MATKLPAAIGKKVDRYFVLLKERLALDKKVKAAKVKENAVRDQIIDALNKEKLDSAKGSLGTVSLTRPEVGQPDDWPVIFSWIKKTGNFDILKRGLSQSGLNDVFAHDPKIKKKGIPGISIVTVTKFHKTAKRGK